MTENDSIIRNPIGVTLLLVDRSARMKELLNNRHVPLPSRFVKFRTATSIRSLHVDDCHFAQLICGVVTAAVRVMPCRQPFVIFGIDVSTEFLDEQRHRRVVALRSRILRLIF